jgi:hypothetical protein
VASVDVVNLGGKNVIEKDTRYKDDTKILHTKTQCCGSRSGNRDLVPV